MADFTRRSFLYGATVLSLSLVSLSCGDKKEAAKKNPDKVRMTPSGYAAPLYGDWQDVYREQWHWDKVVKGAHHPLNCVSACPFNVYVKDGIVFREEPNPIK